MDINLIGLGVTIGILSGAIGTFRAVLYNRGFLALGCLVSVIALWIFGRNLHYLF